MGVGSGRSAWQAFGVVLVGTPGLGRAAPCGAAAARAGCVHTQTWAVLGKIFAAAKQPELAAVPRRALSPNPYLHSNKKRGGGEITQCEILASS